MSRFTRRTLGAAVGIVLGWCAAGVISSYMPIGISLAGTPAEKHSDPHDGASATTEQDDHLDRLVPQEKPVWLRTVIWSTAALFGGAVLLGIPALKIRGTESPDPAEDRGRGH